MVQSRTHNCNELRIENAGQEVTLAGFYDNLRQVSKNLGFLQLRDFYGVTQVVIESEEMMAKLAGADPATYTVTVFKQDQKKEYGGYDIDKLSEQQLIYFIAECLKQAANALSQY